MRTRLLYGQVASFGPSLGASPSITSCPGRFLFIFLVDVVICSFTHLTSVYCVPTVQGSRARTGNKTDKAPAGTELTALWGADGTM